jgi:lipopolysaccharide assembly protein B
MPEFLQEFIESESSVSVPYSERSKLAMQRDTQELIDRLSARVQKDRTALDDYIFLGRLYRMRGDAARALRLHRNLLVRADLLRSTKALLFLELGLDLLDMKIQDFGESYFLQALEIQKHNIPALEGVVRALELQEKYELVADYLKRLIRLGRPEKTHLAYIYTALAQRYFEGGLAAKARRLLQRALKLHPGFLYGQLTLADVYLEAGKHQKAIQQLKKTILQWPSHSFLVLRKLEDAHFRMNAFADYDKTLRDLLRNARENFYIHYSLARHLRKKKRNSDALTALRRCLEINPLYVNALRARVELAGEGDDLTELKALAGRFFTGLKRSRRFICPNCRSRSETIRWRCEKCGVWDVFDVRYELAAP